MRRSSVRSPSTNNAGRHYFIQTRVRKGPHDRGVDCMAVCEAHPRWGRLCINLFLIHRFIPMIPEAFCIVLHSLVPTYLTVCRFHISVLDFFFFLIHRSHSIVSFTRARLCACATHPPTHVSLPVLLPNSLDRPMCTLRIPLVGGTLVKGLVPKRPSDEGSEVCCHGVTCVCTCCAEPIQRGEHCV